MNNNTIQLKVKERLNKLASSDYDNIECWKIVESFNKAQIEWIRRQLRGSNMFRDGDESSGRRIDDLQRILMQSDLTIVKKDLYYESDLELPLDYLEFKRVDVKATKECCEKGKTMMVYLAEEDNRAQLLNDEHKNPSFDWGETFATLISNRIRIFTNNDFDLKKAQLTYYRFPIYIQIKGCIDPYTSSLSTADVNCEFKDDIIELLIDETVAIIAGDIESGNQFTRGKDEAERNN